MCQKIDLMATFLLQIKFTLVLIVKPVTKSNYAYSLIWAQVLKLLALINELRQNDTKKKPNPSLTSSEQTRLLYKHGRRTELR